MLDAIKEWWPIIAFWMAIVGWTGRETFMYFKGRHDALDELEKRITAQEQEHEAHEDICSQRYHGIEQAIGDLKEDIDHLKLDQDKRHEENVDRIDSVAANVDAVKTFLMGRSA